EGESGSTVGPVWSCTTAAPPPPGDIVIYASDMPSTSLHGMWMAASDATSPNGIALSTPDTGFALTDAPASAPTHYVDVSFTAGAGGTHTMRIQVREDGVSLDQIVLSPATYLTSPPGGRTNDSTFVPKP